MRLEKFLQKVMLDFMDKYDEPLGFGAFRVAFHDRKRNVVLKVPINEPGISVNITEDFVYKKYHKKHDGKYAKCKLVYYKGIPIIEMEYVDIPKGAKKGRLPAWSKKFERNQVGWNWKGKAVSFDYGSDWATILGFENGEKLTRDR